MIKKRLWQASLVLFIALALFLPFGGVAHAAELPSCQAQTYYGPDGFLSVQTGPDGFVQWGGGMYNKAENVGYYVIDVLVDGNRADRKNDHYLYFPHGSLPPSKAPSGATLVLQVDLQSDSGQHYVNVTNGCRIP